MALWVKEYKYRVLEWNVIGASWNVALFRLVGVCWPFCGNENYVILTAKTTAKIMSYLLPRESKKLCHSYCQDNLKNYVIVTAKTTSKIMS